ncbi:hypothetical protein T492DRAFT_832942 [Pavlovales sp. CCMP2436]|nr:hypothetical protein T492DRAFT_832942 [Pavlovales sp. CCMP2436]
MLYLVLVLINHLRKRGVRWKGAGGGAGEVGGRGGWGGGRSVENRQRVGRVGGASRGGVRYTAPVLASLPHTRARAGTRAQALTSLKWALDLSSAIGSSSPSPSPSPWPSSGSKPSSSFIPRSVRGLRSAGARLNAAGVRSPPVCRFLSDEWPLSWSPPQPPLAKIVSYSVQHALALAASRPGYHPPSRRSESRSKKNARVPRPQSLSDSTLLARPSASDVLALAISRSTQKALVASRSAAHALTCGQDLEFFLLAVVT